MINKILSTIEKHNLIEKGDSLVVGVSGGPDSVCLIHVLNKVSAELDIRITAVHINHMLRGSEADEDQKYVRTLCNDMKIPLFERAVNIKAISEEKGISLEEAGRETRYSEFAAISESIGAVKIAVAHNRNDQAETVLMNIIRGSGLDGLKGIEYKRGNIIRPLLDISRDDIEDYCRLNNLTPRIDSSNLENIYTRNKVRLELIPFINKLFGTDICDNLVKMASLIKDDGVFLESCVNNAYKDCIIKENSEEVWFSLPKLKNCHISIKKRIIRAGIRYIKGDIKGIESIHIENAIDLVEKGKTGSQLDMPQGISIMKSYEIIKIRIGHKKEKPIKYKRIIDIPGTTVVQEAGISIEAIIEEKAGLTGNNKKISSSNEIQFFDYETVFEGICIRNRENGDFFKPLNSNGTKKLKELFIDIKIPREARDEIPLITKGNEVVWIIGYKINDKFKVTENTKSILILKYKKN